MMLKFEKYFKEGIAKPGIKAAFDPIPIGVRYDYVPVSYLNGFVNYGTFLKAYAIGCYRDWNDLLGKLATVRIRENRWISKFCATPAELFDTVTEPGAVTNSELLEDFATDVILLKKIVHKDYPVQYLFFWFDSYITECCIGRFETEDSEEIVIQEFDDFIKNFDLATYGSREIPLHYFNGRVSG